MTAESIEDNIAKTDSYLRGYEDVNKYFVETELTRKCADKLEELHIVVIIGQQGCGKTLTAVHIMSDIRYNDWIKRKITTWGELLQSDHSDKTLLYIDNLFDGFMYRQGIARWWHALCYFYFEFLHKNNNIRLIITAKDKMMKNACAFVNADIGFFNETCFIHSDKFPLSGDEKLTILGKQIDFARKLEKTDIYFTSGKVDNELKEKPCKIGFPLCAHMYAFEKVETNRDLSIFENPRGYVRKQIEKEIDQDTENDVKTLFLFLLFYLSPTGSDHRDTEILKYSELCRDYLKKNSSKEFFTAMEPLSFNNFMEKAEELEEKVLIKHVNRYTFKHQIYLEGVVDYFCSMHFEAVLKYFPLEIIHSFKPFNFSEDSLKEMIARLRREIDQGSLSEALSCKVFKDPKFEKAFCNDLERDLKNENASAAKLLSLADKTSEYKLPIMFWASKYKLKQLSNTIMDCVVENDEKSLQFYLARFGECCASDEHYIINTTYPNKVEIHLETLQSLVFKFETSEKETILHLLFGSCRTDNDASRLFSRILNDSNKSPLTVDKSLLDLVLRQKKYSRLQCLVKTLNVLPKKKTKNKGYITSLVKDLQSASTANDKFLQLELACRICILIVHGENSFTKESYEAFFNNGNFYPKMIFRENHRLQNDMAERINFYSQPFNLDGRSACADQEISREMLMTPTLQREINKAIMLFKDQQEPFCSKTTTLS